MKRVFLIALCLSCSPLVHAYQLDGPPKVLADSGQVIDLQLEGAMIGPEWPQRVRERGFRVRGEQIQVVVESSRAEWVGRWIEVRGGSHVIVSGDFVQAWLPQWLIPLLAQEDGITRIGRPDYAVIPLPPIDLASEKEGAATSEGVAAMNAPAWHNAGFIGSGIKVGIIDGGFEDYETLLGSDLPSADHIEFRSFGGTTNNGSGNHGTGCAEVVYDIAPGAELYLALVSTNFEIQTALHWLETNGVHVATMSLGFMTLSPGDGTGDLHDRIAVAVHESDLVFATSAGNSRQSHWQGQTTDDDGNDWVEFKPGEEINIFPLSFSDGDTISTSIVWNDWTNVDQDYSLHLFRLDEDDNPEEVATADRLQTGGLNQRPTESLSFTVHNAGWYGIGVFRKNVDGVNDLEVFDPELDLGIGVEEGSLTIPADSPDVLAVAAASSSGSYTVRSFSSAGPANGPGGSLDGGLMKPNITGYDGVSTVTLGSFYGTSAASPHVAGAAALVREAYPTWDQAEVRVFLEEQAIDKGVGGQDINYGWGRLNLGLEPGSTCEFSISPEMVTIAADNPGPRVTVTTTEGCFWTVSSNTSWLEALPDSAVGPGRVVVRAEANTTSSAREGTVRIAGIDFVVTQEGLLCEVELLPLLAEYAAAGGNGEIQVDTDPDCAWTAVTTSSWIEITAGESGSGDGSVQYFVEANMADADRLGTIEIGDGVVSISQSGRAGAIWVSRVGGIADKPGAEETRWNSDLALLNSSDTDVEATLVYRHEDGEASRTATIGAGEIEEWKRAPVTLFQVEDSSGVVEVTADGPLEITARTYNDSATGTFGQFLPGVSVAEALAAGETAVLAPLASNDGFRTNVGFVDVSGDGGTGIVTLFDTAGNQRGNTVEIEVSPGGWSQQDRIFDEANAGDCDSCYAVVEVLGGLGGLWSYASVVDNGSGDPTTVFQVPLTAAKTSRRWLVAGIAEGAGDNDTQWKSTLAVVNHSGGFLGATVGFRSSEGASDVDLDFPGNGMNIWNDAVGDLFHMPSSAGAVEIVSAGAPVTTARTYNEGSEGTFGQFLPAVEESQAIGEGEVGLLTQIKRTTGFRTNIGFVNFGDVLCEVKISLFDEEGVKKGTEIEVEVPAGGWFQKNRVFNAAGIDECPLGYAQLEVISPDCKVWGYASVVDNGSGDPTTIPMSGK
ncbi:MAG: S8 family serine peptidase [Thermoanaerobaculales bacterium]|nr:S8 family serine peptidase [Thermoanaerobaculales bacterium]